MNDATPLSRGYALQLDREMRAILAPPDEVLKPLYGMMHYHMGWADPDFTPQQTYPGKRMRPFLLLLVCEAVGGKWQAALPAAAAIELLHNFSLIHDDIEDHSPVRRGRPTVWSLWGIPHSVNVGDIMFSHAHLAISRLQQTGFPPGTVQTAFALLNRVCISLCQGQYLDLEYEGRLEVDVPLYMKMIENKTAALIACAAEMGALMGGASQATMKQYRRFGRELGLGFQIVDDILGTWGDPRITGKPVHDDLRAKKKTLPVIHAMDVERDLGQEAMRDLCSRKELSDEGIEGMLAILRETGSRQYAQDTVNQCRARALEALEATGIDNEAQQALFALPSSVLNREH